MPDGIVVFSLRESDIIFASKTARRAISLGFSRISLRSNITRRKANITEKDDCFRNRLFPGGRGWNRTTEAKTQQIYSLPPLATRELSHIKFNEKMELVDGLEPPTC